MFCSPGAAEAIRAALPASANLVQEAAKPAIGNSETVHADPDPAALPWWRVSDQSVKRVRWADVAACEAYLLVYVRY